MTNHAEGDIWYNTKTGEYRVVYYVCTGPFCSGPLVEGRYTNDPLVTSYGPVSDEGFEGFDRIFKAPVGDTRARHYLEEYANAYDFLHRNATEGSTWAKYLSRKALRAGDTLWRIRGYESQYRPRPDWWQAINRLIVADGGLCSHSPLDAVWKEMALEGILSLNTDVCTDYVVIEFKTHRTV